jgi:hypothetical protein
MSVERSPISRQRAFLIHLRAETTVPGDRILGRVEHVASGRSEQFESEEELWAFVFRTLGDLEERPNGEVLPETIRKL